MSNNSAQEGVPHLTYGQSLRIGWYLFTRIVGLYFPFWLFYDAAPYNSGLGWIGRLLAGLLPPLPLLWWVSPRLLGREFNGFRVLPFTDNRDGRKERWRIAWALYWRSLILTAGLDGMTTVAFVVIWAIGSGERASGEVIQQASRGIAKSLSQGIYPLGIAFFGLPLALKWVFLEFRLRVSSSVLAGTTYQAGGNQGFQPKAAFGIGTCPKCQARVLPTAEGTCPSCQSFLITGRS